MKLLLFALLCLILACHTTTDLGKAAPLPEDWTLVEIPNSLDQIGTVFAIKKSRQTYITKLNVPVENGLAKLQGKKISKAVDVNFLLGFLGIKDAGLTDTVKVSSSFDVSSATLLRPVQPISGYFNAKKDSILQELNFYSMDNADVYIVTEIIKAKDVNISFNKLNNASVNVSTILGGNIDLKTAGISISKNDSTSLHFNLPDSLTIFYKLNRIQLQHIKHRDAVKQDSIKNIILDTTPLLLNVSPSYN